MASTNNISSLSASELAKLAITAETEASFRELSLTRTESGLDFTIKGGQQIKLPIIVSRVISGGVAERGSLQVGDVLYEINGKSVAGMGQAEACEILRMCQSEILLKVRHNKVFERALATNESICDAEETLFDSSTNPSPEKLRKNNSETSGTSEAGSELPQGWFAVEIGTRTIYVCDATKETSWIHPLGKSADKLPYGWTSHVDAETGLTVYSNHFDKSTQFERPEKPASTHVLPAIQPQSINRTDNCTTNNKTEEPLESACNNNDDEATNKPSTTVATQDTPTVVDGDGVRVPSLSTSTSKTNTAVAVSEKQGLLIKSMTSAKYAQQGGMDMLAPLRQMMAQKGESTLAAFEDDDGESNANLKSSTSDVLIYKQKRVESSPPTNATRAVEVEV